ncbi:hypothetical protein [Trueperella pyogenes]|uniref:hypothetical protein n=1 Tax=Trueperella pyogenes TaxID=1661 RepID=UPI003256489E
MDPNTIASIVAATAAWAAAIAALVALKPAQRAAKAAEAQTELQRDLMHQAAQPYVWADIQPDNQQGTMLHLVLGNAGPTVARNVRVVIDPPIPADPNHAESSVVAQRRLREGVLSLAPGRTIRWSLGKGFDLLKDADDKTVYRIRVTAEGPYGEVEPVETEVRLSDWREARDAPDGSLHHIRKEIENLTKVVKSLKKGL